MNIDRILKKEIYRVEEVAQLFDMNPRSIYRWIEAGRLDSKRLPSGQIRVHRDAIKKIFKDVE